MKLTNAIAMTVLIAACGGDAPEDAPATAEVKIESVPASTPFDVQLSQCKHAERAAIYGRSAELWQAEYYGSGDIRSLNLTVWRLASDSSLQFSLRARQGDNTYFIDTVEGSQKVGSGGVLVTAAGEGSGTQIVVEGKDQSGNELRATVSCNDLIEPVIEGG